MQRVLAAVAIMLIQAASGLAADEWGDLTMRFVYDGQPPKPRAFPIDKDRAICKEGEVVDESLLVSSKDRSIANVVVWLTRAKGDAAAPIHPGYEKAAKSEVPLVVKNCRYEPHVTLVRSSQVLVLKVLDPIGHTFKVDSLNNTFDHILPPGRDQKVNFTKAEDVPAKVGCHIHPWMHGILFVHDNPCMAVSDTSGALKLANIPVGRWTFRLWHERSGFLRSFTHDGREVNWPSEGLSLDIRPGANDLGEVFVKPAVFKE